MAEKTTSPSPSKTPTIEFIKEARKIPGYSLFALIHGLIYGRWPYLYIGIGKGDHPIARFLDKASFWKKLFPKPPREQTPEHTIHIPSRTIADEYHGKVVPLEEARQLVSVREPIHLPDLEHIIPYVKARSIIQHNPDHIAVLDCPCRAVKDNPCLPLDVCLIIREPFTSQIIRYYPDKARRITQDEAVRIIEEEEERGHVHHAFFKEAMLGRFYAICNCCDCCCGAINAHKNHTPMLASSGFVARVDPERCQNCGVCVDCCQFGALEQKEQHVLPDPVLCMGCGICVSHCSFNAIELLRDESKGEPLEILTLMEQARQAAARPEGG